MPLDPDQIELDLTCICGSSVQVDLFRYYALQLLLNIAQDSAIGGGAGALVDANWIPTVRVAFGALTAGYVVALNNTDDKRYVSVQNNTDAQVSVSFGGSSESFALNAYNSVRLTPGSEGLQFPQAIYLKYVGAAPTTGEVIISAYS